MGDIPFEAYLDASDLNYEISILKDPSNEQNWWNYIKHKESNKDALLVILFRSLTVYQGNENLWTKYISLRIELNNDGSLNEMKAILNLFSQALKYIDQPSDNFYNFYMSFLVDHIDIEDSSLIAQRFNRLLKVFSSSRHSIVWSNYLKLLKSLNNGDQFTLWQRYWIWCLKSHEFSLKLIAENQLPDLDTALENLCRLTKSLGQFEQVLSYFNQLITMKLITKLETSEFNLNLYLFNSLTNLLNISTIDNDKKILLEKIQSLFVNLVNQFPDQMVSLCIKYSKVIFQFKSPATAFEFLDTHLLQCQTINEFSLLFDYLSLSIDKYATTLLEANELNKFNETLLLYEQLLSKRDLLLNDIKIKKAPNSVSNWLSRIKIFENEKDTNKVLETYSKAILTIDISKVPYNERMLLPKLWCNYSLMYFKHDDFETAYSLFETACDIPWIDVKQKEYVIIGFSNMLIDSDLNEGLQKGIDLLKHFLEDQIENYDKSFNIKNSVKLWSYYIDLSENLPNSSTETIRLYELAIKNKISSALMILNYCDFLIEHKWIEKSFAVFERAIELFSNESRYFLIGIYLKRVLEFQKVLNWSSFRVRSIFENCIDLEFIEQRQFDLILMLINWEYNNNESKIQVYNILTKFIQSVHSQIIKLNCIKILVSIQDDLLSLEDIYMNAMETISVNTFGFVDDIVVGFVNTEIGLQAPEKARQILRYSSENIMKFGKSVSLRDKIWRFWKAFELENGNESSYKDMLRVKRSLESIFKPNEELEKTIFATGDQNVGFVKSKSGPKTTTFTFENDNTVSDKPISNNEDAIDLEMSDFE